MSSPAVAVVTVTSDVTSTLMILQSYINHVHHNNSFHHTVGVASCRLLRIVINWQLFVSDVRNIGGGLGLCDPAADVRHPPGKAVQT